MKFRQFISEKREIIDGVEYFVNPSAMQVLALTRKWKTGHGKWLLDRQTKNFYLWAAYDATHQDASRSILGVSVLDFSRQVNGETQISDKDGTSEFWSQDETPDGEKLYIEKYAQYFDEVDLG